jgi:hypothetical protein
MTPLVDGELVAQREDAKPRDDGRFGILGTHTVLSHLSRRIELFLSLPRESIERASLNELDKTPAALPAKVVEAERRQASATARHHAQPSG